MSALSPTHPDARLSPLGPRSSQAVPWLLALFTAAVLVGGALWLIAGQIARPYVYDDVSFIFGARAVADTGRPFGNQGYLLHLYWEREQWALWHPPLYMYLLGATVWLFGDSEPAARGFGVVCLVVAAAFAFDLARRRIRDQGGSAGRALAAGVVAVALYVLNPLAIQASMALDIDNTILMVLTAGFVWLAIRLPGPWSVRTMAWLALLFALALWAKMTTPLILAAALVFTRAFQRPTRPERGEQDASLAGIGWQGALQALVVVVLGTLIFAVSWVAVSAAAGFPISYTLEVVRNEAIESGASSRDRLVSLLAFANGVAPAILWIGPFFCLLFVAAGLPRLWGLLRGNGLRASDILVVLGAAIYLVYIFKLAGNLPKYHAAMLPLWAAAAGALVVSAVGRPTSIQYAVGVVGTAILFWWLQDRMLDSWGIAWEESLNTGLIVAPLLIGLGLAMLWALAGRCNLLGALPVALCLLTLAWSVALDVTQLSLPGSTTYYYGRYGQREAAVALDALLGPDELYVASKEIAWYAQHRHFVDQESWQHVVWDLNGGRYDDTYLGMPIRVVALEVGEESLRWAYDGLLLRRGYRYAGEYGNYLFYLRP